MNVHLYLCRKMRTRDEKKEEAIREKAMEMIVEEGFDGLSMQKLARAAEVSPATIYIYYKNREDLLTNLYNHVQEKFSEVVLRKFNPDLSLEEGLWVQWKNRLKFIMDYPVYFRFQEQFRNSPCINQKNVNKSEFKEAMKQFVMNAIRRGELQKMEPEMFWAMAYGTFYTLVKFHFDEKSMMGNNFRLTDAKLKETLKMVVKGFKN